MLERILVTGATGYIGGRLVPRLLEAGYAVRCMVRDRQRLESFAWSGDVEIVEGDAHDYASVLAAMQGCDAAYYLIHGMQGHHPNVERDLHAATTFTLAAQNAHLQRIIYLGQLPHSSGYDTPYLQSRHETGEILRRGTVPVIEFETSMIVGSGSVLFEMMRYTAERQPVFFCPRWFFSESQPLSIADVLRYLIDALKLPEGANETIQIGGPERLTYAELLLACAHAMGLKRALIRLPFSAPEISAWWIHMITPVHWRVILPLIEGMRSDSVVDGTRAKQLFPQIEPLKFDEALRASLGRVASNAVETSWSDALVVTQGDVRPVTLTTTEGMIFERRRLNLSLPANTVFQAFSSLGGNVGWLYMNWAWQIRGWMDKLVGGVGLRRGRRNPHELRVGDSLDFWRVEEMKPGRLLRLRAEMKVPGKAWMEFQAIPKTEQETQLVQTAYFAPHGLAGFLYWYLLYPIHSFIFSGLIRGIAKRAEGLEVKAS